MWNIMCDVMYDSEGPCHEPMVYVQIIAKTYLSLRSAPSVVLPNNNTKDRSETSVKKTLQRSFINNCAYLSQRNQESKKHPRNIKDILPFSVENVCF